MNDARRFYRRAQLCAMRADSPEKFADHYREASGLKPHDPLPAGLGLVEMVNTIIDFEERDLYSSRVLRAIAG